MRWCDIVSNKNLTIKKFNYIAMTTTKEIFTNPDNLPLGKLKLTIEENGINIKVPALNKRWITRNAFNTYISLITSGGKIKTDANIDEWFHESEWFYKDMEYLLSLKHYKFWSYITYQKTVLKAIISFLQHANPFYIDLKKTTNDKRAIDLYEKILNSVIRVICRIITNKESDEEWITKDHMRELIYSNFLITIPMLFDLIVACGNLDTQNCNILKKIFETVFALEPNYKMDLAASLQFFKNAFKTIQIQAENEGQEGAGGGIESEVDELETPYDDVVLYTLDCAFTMSILLDIYPDSRSLCSNINLGLSISTFYDNTIPYLYKNIYFINENAQSLQWLNQARVQFLTAFRGIVNFYIDEVLEKPDESLMLAESFVALLTECLSERTFVVDYQREYPVELDMDIIKQACKDLDYFKADFVANGYKQEAETDSYRNVGNNKSVTVEEKRKKSKDRTELPSILHNGSSMNANSQKPVIKSRNDSNVEQIQRDLDLEVCTVRDVLPHLGDGFVRRVLARYDNSEEAIAAILEENLPPDLTNADQAEVYIPPDPQDTLYNQTGIKRYNVFDGDAYDVMTQDNPNCIIKLGKGFPNKPQNAADLLDDKSDLKELKHLYEQYSLVSEGGSEDETEYNDEYDDSYEAFLESEKRVTLSKQLKDGLADIVDNSDDDSEDDKEDYQEQLATRTISNNEDKRKNFCENPEDIRARYEAKRNAKYGNKSKASTDSVVGNQKGQGQDKKTLLSRHKKDVNKSSRANHNRKAGASFKRSKGMIA